MNHETERKNWMKTPSLSLARQLFCKQKFGDDILFLPALAKFYFVLVNVVLGTDTALLSNFTMLSAYCTIACSLGRQHCRNITSLLTSRSLGRQNCKL
jgi:hypothetical protein